MAQEKLGAVVVIPHKKKAKFWYQQAFKKEWMEDEDLKDWVQPASGDKYAVQCSVCNCKLKNCNKSSLLAHKASLKHVKSFKSKKTKVNIQQHFKKVSAFSH